MTKRNPPRKTSVICLLVVLCFCFFDDILVTKVGAATKGIYLNDISPEDAEVLLLMQKWKQLADRERSLAEQEHRIVQEKAWIKELLVTKERENEKFEESQDDNVSSTSDNEELPDPSPMQSPNEHQNKRAWMNLCHFKICNMGRKRKSK